MTPTTKAGRALLDAIGWRVNVEPSILLIEAEAAAQERERWLAMSDIEVADARWRAQHGLAEPTDVKVHMRQSTNGCVTCPRKWSDHTPTERQLR